MRVKDIIVEEEQIFELPSTAAIMKKRKAKPQQATGGSWWDSFTNWAGKVVSSVAADVTGGAIGQHYRGKRDDTGTFIPGTAPKDVATTTPEPPKPAKTRPLRRGSRGADVKAMQKAMNL